MKIELNATIGEINAVEDLATCWLLCEKHKQSTSLVINEKEIFAVQSRCKKCQEIVNKNKKRALHLWSKLIHAYCIAKDGKCACQKGKCKK